MSFSHPVLFENGIIRRIQSTSDEDPPWAGIAFISRVGSDVLAEQLKGVYPEGADHRERKYIAAINFLTGELNAIRTARLAAAGNYGHASPEGFCRQPIGTIDHSNVIPSLDTTAQMASQITPSASPISRSPMANSPGKRTRREASVTKRQSPSSTLVRDRNSQTLVFSAANGEPMEIRRKKKMSETELEDYKKTRKRGACNECKRAKIKCTHADQDANASSSPKSTTSRVSVVKRSSSPEPGHAEVPPKRFCNDERAHGVSLSAQAQGPSPQGFVVPASQSHGTKREQEQQHMASGQSGYVHNPDPSFRTQSWPSISPSADGHFHPTFQGDLSALPGSSAPPHPSMDAPHDNYNGLDFSWDWQLEQ